MLLNEFFIKKLYITEGGNLASHTADGTPTVGWTGIPGQHTAGKIDSENRRVMQPAVKQLLVDINNTFTRQYGRPIWSPELIEKEVHTFISGSSKWFMFLKQPNPNFDPKQPVSDANPKEIGVTDKDFQRVKKKVGDIDTQIDRRLEPQIEEFVHKNIGKNIGSATLLGTKKGSDQWLALWQLHEPPITLQVDLEFVDYTSDDRGFEVPTEWAQISHGSDWADLEAGMKGVFRQWLYRSIAKVAPSSKYIAKLAGRGKARSIAIFGGDDGKEQVTDFENPPPPFHDANFSFAVASVGGGGVRAKYRAPNPEENIPSEINGIPVMVPLTPAESDYIKDMDQQFEQFFGVSPEGNETKMMAGLVGTVELMKKYFTPEQQGVAVQEFLKINFGPGAQMIEANNPTEDFKIKMTAVDYVLDKTGMKNLRKQALQMAKQYEEDFNSKKGNVQESILREDEPPAVKAQLRKGMPHLHDLKAPDFLDLIDELHDGNGRFKLQNIPLNVKVDGFGGRFGKNAEGKPFMGTSRTEPRYQAGFLKYHQEKGTTDPDILGRAKTFDDLFYEMMDAVKLVDSKLGPEFLINKQVTCEVLYLPFATETPEGKLKFVGIAYDKLPKGVQLALVPFRVVNADTGEDLPDSNAYIKKLLSVGKAGTVMFIDNSLTQNDALDVTEIINPLENIEELKQIVTATAGKRDRASLQLKREVEEKLQPIKIALEKAIIEDPNIVGKDLLGKDYEGIVINSRLGPIKVTSQEQRNVIQAKNDAKANARTERPRNNSNKTAVVAIGSFVGHIGHEQLFDYTIKKAQQVGGDPYLFIGNAQGKDDPIPPSVKVQTWHKMYPEYANNISTVTHEGGTLMQKIKHELINPLPGKPPRYDNIIIMVGEDQAKMPIANALMKAVNKFQGYEHVKVSLEVTPRGTGMSFTKLRNILQDPNATPQQQLSVWEQGFDVKKLGQKWIEHLMDLTRQGMGIQQPKPTPKGQQDMKLNTFTDQHTNEDLGAGGEHTGLSPISGNNKDLDMSGRGRGWNSTMQDAEDKDLGESTSLDSTLSSIVDNGKHIAQVYEVLKSMAKKWVDNRGDLKGFGMMAAGQGSRWYNDFYFNKLQKELYDLTKQAGRGSGQLMDFLNSEGRGRSGHKTFTQLSSELPPILKNIAQKLRNQELYTFAGQWEKRQADYEAYLEKIELEANSDDYDEPSGPKVPKNNTIGTQNNQADILINKAIKDHIPSKHQGEIRNMINKLPMNKRFAALEKAINKFKTAGESMAGVGMEQHARETGQRWKGYAGGESIGEAMLPKSAFAGSKKNKLGPAGQLKGNMKRPARQGDLVGGSESIENEDHGEFGKASFDTAISTKIHPGNTQLGMKKFGEDQRLDPKCWKGYRKQGTKMKGGTRVNNCVKVGEAWENEIAKAIKLLENK